MEALELKVQTQPKKETVEELSKNAKTVTNEEIEQSLNYDLLTEEEKQAIDEFNAKIDLHDTTQVLQYGSAAQAKVSEFSDQVLEGVKTKNLGEVGDQLADLVAQIKAFDSGIVEKKGLAKLFSSAKKEVNTIIAKYNKIENNIDSIEQGLDKSRITLLKDISIFDTMYDKNLEFFKEISLYIIAGEKKLEELKNVELPKLREAALASGEQIDAQKVNDLEGIINRFEKKLYDLKTTRIISIQMAPQIRLLQNNDAELVEKIQTSITNTIPLWKNQMVLALGISNSKRALEQTKAVSNITNEMLQKNSETLKQGSVEIARESEKAIVDIETLKKTNADIIETIDSVIKIHEDGRIKRAEAEKELQAIEQELKDKLIQINVPKTEE